MEGEEGCLSIPGVNAPVVRNEKITIQAYNLAGEEFEGELDGLYARIVQHEVDHLDGVLLVDHLRGMKRRLFLRRVAKMRKLGVWPVTT